MSREQIVEAMARALWEQADDEVGWEATLSLAATGEVYMIGQVEWTRESARLALTALEAAFPGLSDLIEGRAVIVPVEVTEEIERALADALDVFQSPHGSFVLPSTIRPAYAAALATSPYRKEQP